MGKSPISTVSVEYRLNIVFFDRNMSEDKDAAASDVSDGEGPTQGEEEEGVELIVLDPDTTDVDLQHGKIARIENLEHLTQVETISLRWNLIKKIENLNSPR